MKITVKQLKQLIKEQVEETKRKRETSMSKLFRAADEDLERVKANVRTYLSQTRPFYNDMTIPRAKLMDAVQSVLDEQDQDSKIELKTFE